LPAERHYVGLTPVINPAYLHSTESGLKAARADLFKKGLIAIVAPPGTNSEAIKLAADLAQLLGATPLFTDQAEIEGLMASTHLLPQLLAAALLNITVDQPGWLEGRKVAGRAYAEVTSPAGQLDDAKSLQAAAFLTQANVLRLLDNMIASLHAMRNDIASHDDKSLEERLRHAQLGRETWWGQRQAGAWDIDLTAMDQMPKRGDFIGNLFGIRRKPKPIPKK
jgi:prephenate dehydrogenase